MDGLLVGILLAGILAFRSIEFADRLIRRLGDPGARLTGRLRGPLRDVGDRDGCRHGAGGGLAEGRLLPDGRLYVSAVYSEQDAEQTISAFDCILARLAVR